VAETCAAVGLAERAEDLYERLEPFRTQLIDNGVAPIGVTAHFLGLLAGCVGDHGRAVRDFNEAATIYRRLDAPVLLARTEEAWGRILLTRGDEGDRERAATLLQSALTTARITGARRIALQAEKALA
jgi:hypothetical protein